jgi:hypothetical protein
MNIKERDEMMRRPSKVSIECSPGYHESIRYRASTWNDIFCDGPTARHALSELVFCLLRRGLVGDKETAEMVDSFL